MKRSRGSVFSSTFRSNGRARAFRTAARHSIITIPSRGSIHPPRFHDHGGGNLCAKTGAAALPRPPPPVRGQLPTGGGGHPRPRPRGFRARPFRRDLRSYQADFLLRAGGKTRGRLQVNDFGILKNYRKKKKIVLSQNGRIVTICVKLSRARITEPYGTGRFERRRFDYTMLFFFFPVYTIPQMIGNRLETMLYSNTFLKF